MVMERTETRGVPRMGWLEWDGQKHKEKREQEKRRRRERARELDWMLGPLEVYPI